MTAIVRAPGLELMASRRFETKDIVKRVGAVSPARIRLRNHPLARVLSAFNPGLEVKDDELLVYPRIIVGYFTYTSAVALIRLPLGDVLAGRLPDGQLEAELVVWPTCEYDFWGVEDPRITACGGRLYMAYAGRTQWFFTTRSERVLPLLAVSEDGLSWSKIAAFTFKELREKIGFNKDAFLAVAGGRHYLFYRIDVPGQYYALASPLPEGALIPSSKPGLVELEEAVELAAAAPFEEKIGWGTPLVEVEPGKYITILHGVDRELTVYRAFAALYAHSDKEGFQLLAVTPGYIMEPKEIYEVYGDRPYVVFPCGAVRVDDVIIIAYGGADSVFGIGILRVDELLSELEKGPRTE